MNSKKLHSARDFEKKYMTYVAEELPDFHVTGGIGWINDPNGWAPYKGEYHLFYQYYPYDTKWGPMHWGHVKTKDFIHWDRLPVALAPDMEYDKDGVFSGGAVEMPDGRHLLMYTGVRNVRRRNGKLESYQTQCIAIGDGVNYEKYAGNPVITSDQVPEGGSVHDFRDPHIWMEDGKYRMVVGNRTPDTSGTIETTGAGDTFCASVLSFVLEHGIDGLSKDDRQAMLRFANAAAYIVTTRKGAIRSMPERKEVEELLAKN